MLYKLLLILLPLLITGEDNLLDWSPSRKLTWNDFEGKPDPASEMSALTSSNIKIDLAFNDKLFKYGIKCRFNKQKSWVRHKSEDILKHEQGHFDITEIHARILNKQLLEYKFNGKTVNEDINRIYDDVMKDHVSAQYTYDRETNHSIDSLQQVNWDKKIVSMLEKYENYSDYKQLK